MTEYAITGPDRNRVLRRLDEGAVTLQVVKEALKVAVVAMASESPEDFRRVFGDAELARMLGDTKHLMHRAVEDICRDALDATRDGEEDRSECAVEYADGATQEARNHRTPPRPPPPPDPPPVRVLGEGEVPK